jgi:hypothetical protein
MGVAKNRMPAMAVIKVAEILAEEFITSEIRVDHSFRQRCALGRREDLLHSTVSSPVCKLSASQAVSRVISPCRRQYPRSRGSVSKERMSRFDTNASPCTADQAHREREIHRNRAAA